MEVKEGSEVEIKVKINGSVNTEKGEIASTEGNMAIIDMIYVDDDGNEQIEPGYYEIRFI